MVGFKHYVIFILVTLSFYSLHADEIIIGVEEIPKRKVAVFFSPIVIPDLISAKMAVEYRLNPKFNLILPVTAKWMNYRWAIRLFDEEFPNSFYGKDLNIRPGYNLDYSQFLLQMGFGLKAFPFSTSMTNAFFIKSALLIGVERFNAFSAEGVKDSAVITMEWGLGCSWVKGNILTFGIESGLEHTSHITPIEKYPSLLNGFMPFLQFSLGFLL